MISQSAHRGETQSGAALTGPGQPETAAQLLPLKAKKKPLFLAAFFCVWLALFYRINVIPDRKTN